ncbi:MAG: flavin reductase family protein [Planctomycetota bacterium]
MANQKQGRIYHLMNSLVVPRPIAFVTTLGPSGVVNAAPFSWFNAVSAAPPLLSISIARRGEDLKDTARNIRHHGEFVVNICSRNLAPEVSLSAGDWPPEVSEVKLSNLHTLPGTQVKVPRIQEAAAQMECQLDRIITVGDNHIDLVLGKVVAIHVREDLVDERGRVNVLKLDPLARLSGDDFCGIDGIFNIPRGSDGRHTPPA